MKDNSELKLKEIIKELKSYSIEKQVSVSNDIINNIESIIDQNLTSSLSSFKSLIGDLGCIQGKRILLIQPEKYMTMAVFLCLNGAAMVYGLNRFVESEERLSTYYEKLSEFILKNKKSIIINDDSSDESIKEKLNGIVSIDNKKMLAYLNRDKIRFSLCEDTSFMPYQDSQFDIVISDYTFETLFYPYQSLSEIKRVMVNDALLYMRVNPFGKENKTSRAINERLKHKRVSYEKSFSYKNTDYLNRILKDDLIFYLNNFNLKVHIVKDVGRTKISDFDKKDIMPEFILSAGDDLNVTSFTVMALKEKSNKDCFSNDDYKTYAKGLDLYHKGKLNAARARLESLITKQSGEAENNGKKHSIDDRIHHAFFYTLYSLKDYEGAIKSFKKIRKTSMGKRVKDLYCFADCHYNLMNYDNAKKSLTKANEIDPKQYIVVNAMGLCDYKKGDKKEALKKIRQSVKLFPYFSEGLNNIGMILESINKKKAIEHFKIVLTIDPGHNQALLSMGRMLYEEGYYEEASKYLKEYLIIDGSDETALKMHIECLIKLGLQKTAQKEMEDILEKDPSNIFISNMFEEFMSNTI